MLANVLHNHVRAEPVTERRQLDATDTFLAVLAARAEIDRIDGFGEREQVSGLG